MAGPSTYKAAYEQQSFPTNIEAIDKTLENAMKWTRHFLENGVNFEEFMDQHRQQYAGRRHGRHIRRCPYVNTRAAAEKGSEAVGTALNKLFEWLSPEGVEETGVAATASSKDNSTTGKFELVIDVDGFEPEDLFVKVAENYVEVEAKRLEAGSGKLLRHMTYRYLLPDHLDMDSVKSTLKDDHLLVIEAKPKVARREIPVTIVRGGSNDAAAKSTTIERSSPDADTLGYEKVEKQQVEMNVD